MSSVSSLSTGQPVGFQRATYPNPQLLVCINRVHEPKRENLSPSELATVHDGDSQELVRRLCHQRSKLTRLYDTEIEQCRATSKLITFLNKIDQLINEYDERDILLTNATSLTIDDSIPSTIEARKCLADESYSSYFNDVSSLNDSDGIDANALLDYQQSHKLDTHCPPEMARKIVNSIQTKSEPQRSISNNELGIVDFDDDNETIPTDYDDHSYSKMSRNKKLSTKNAKKSTILELKRYKYEGCCPLTTRTYGLDSIKHGIRHFPCTRVTAPINLYKHLIQYHQLTHAPSMQIVRLLADDGEEGDVDLFSSQVSSLIATHPTVYRAQCPLNQYGKFGITAEHKVRLCTQPNQPIGAPLIEPKDVCLYDHFVVYHQMKRSCAQRLAEAIVKNKSGPVFRPDEQLLNETFYVQCPLRHPKAICWKSPISTRHMGQHLTGIHKLDTITRRQIMMTLRKQPSLAKTSDEH